MDAIIWVKCPYHYGYKGNTLAMNYTKNKWECEVCGKKGPESTFPGGSENDSKRILRIPRDLNGIVTEDELRIYLTKKYKNVRGYSNEAIKEFKDRFGINSRDIYKYENKNGYGDFTIYSLDGSPCKGYAMHIPELKKVVLYDCNGISFKEIKNIYKVIP